MVIAVPAAAQGSIEEWMDLTYGVDGIGQLSGQVIMEAAVDDVGRALVVTADVGSPPNHRLQRLLPDGTVDTTFAGGALALSGYVGDFVADTYDVFGLHGGADGAATIVGWMSGIGLVATRYTSTGSRPDVRQRWALGH